MIANQDIHFHPAAESSIASLDPLRWEELRQLAGDAAPVFLAELISCYLEETAQLLQSLQTAVTQADMMTLRRVAHAIKSSSASLGASTLAQLCRKIEQLSTIDACAVAAPYVAQAKAEFQRVQAALQIEGQRYGA